MRSIARAGNLESLREELEIETSLRSRAISRTIGSNFCLTLTIAIRILRHAGKVIVKHQLWSENSVRGLMNLGMS